MCTSPAWVAAVVVPLGSLMVCKTVVTLCVNKWGLQIIWFVALVSIIQDTVALLTWLSVCVTLQEKIPNIGDLDVEMLVMTWLAAGVCIEELEDWSKAMSWLYCSWEIGGSLLIWSYRRLISKWFMLGMVFMTWWKSIEFVAFLFGVSWYMAMRTQWEIWFCFETALQGMSRNVAMRAKQTISVIRWWTEMIRSLGSHRNRCRW